MKCSQGSEVRIHVVHVRAVKYISIKYMPGQWSTCKGGAVAHSYSLHPKHVRVVL